MGKSASKLKKEQWLGIVKNVSKQTGWKFKSFFIFKLVDDFFFEVSPGIYPEKSLIYAQVQFKPYVVDEIFWEIVELEGNKRLPLSFRGNGAFTLRSTPINLIEIDVQTEPPIVDIENMMRLINDQVIQIKKRVYDLDTFMIYLKNKPDNRDNWSDNDLLIVANIIQGNFKEAISLITGAEERRKMCSYGFGAKSFYDLAKEYCEKKQAPSKLNLVDRLLRIVR